MCLRYARGVTLIELVVFIVLVGVAMAGTFAAFNTMTAASADPQVRKQVLAIAESLMEEVSLMPFTWCDPDDPLAAGATGTVGCTGASTIENIGPEGTGCPGDLVNCEQRGSATIPFDNVSDYNGYAMNPGILDINLNAVAGLEAYTASIAVAQPGITPDPPFAGEAIAASEALRISVTVTAPGGVIITLEGYRTRYAPNTLP